MANLIYVANTSLDGYTEDKDGKFDWTEPSDEYFRFITNLVRAPRTYLYGRRMYETMMVWETDPNLAAESPLRRDFAEVWQAADKIVYSRTLETVSTRKTQLEQTFDPEAIRLVLEFSKNPKAAELDTKRFYDNTLIREINRDYASKLFAGQVK